jgi:hypothetical protein
VQKRISLSIVVIGALLMAFKIITESEPGLIPIALVLFGSGWYIVAGRRKPERAD